MFNNIFQKKRGGRASCSTGWTGGPQGPGNGRSVMLTRYNWQLNWLATIKLTQARWCCVSLLRPRGSSHTPSRHRWVNVHSRIRVWEFAHIVKKMTGWHRRRVQHRTRKPKRLATTGQATYLFMQFRVLKHKY